MEGETVEAAAAAASPFLPPKTKSADTKQGRRTSERAEGKRGGFTHAAIVLTATHHEPPIALQFSPPPPHHRRRRQGEQNRGEGWSASDGCRGLGGRRAFVATAPTPRRCRHPPYIAAVELASVEEAQRRWFRRVSAVEPVPTTAADHTHRERGCAKKEPPRGWARRCGGSPPSSTITEDPSPELLGSPYATVVSPELSWGFATHSDSALFWVSAVAIVLAAGKPRCRHLCCRKQPLRVYRELPSFLSPAVKLVLPESTTGAAATWFPRVWVVETVVKVDWNRGFGCRDFDC
ncbi:uncharacterized protein DS421_19g669890 [Arachis hypogaea]|uniref:Uncharacterized protein n=1 Tax=Arachis hypogaea TaxID=3818 RepID=A0A6B9VFE1_ARAHY|nr:uncharacterized protein DS421_19g669890 [Arachis hypogaea]